MGKIYSNEVLKRSIQEESRIAERRYRSDSVGDEAPRRRRAGYSKDHNKNADTQNEDRAEIDPAYFRIMFHYDINQIGALSTH
jgi:hypothetical protein